MSSVPPRAPRCHLLAVLLPCLPCFPAAGADGVLLHAENPARWREATLSCGTDYGFDELPAAFGATRVRIAAGGPDTAELWSGLPSERSVVRADDVCQGQVGTRNVRYIVEGPVSRAGIAYRLVVLHEPAPAASGPVRHEPPRRTDLQGRWRCETEGLTSFAVLDADGGAVSLLRTIGDDGVRTSVDCVGRWLDGAHGRVSVLMNCTLQQGPTSRRFETRGVAWLRDPVTLEWRGDDGKTSLCERAPE